MKKLFPLLLLLAACAGQTEPSTATDTKKQDTDTIRRTVVPIADVPKGFLPTRSLDDEANIQYADTARQFYFVADEESGEDVDLALLDEVTTAHLPRLERYAIVRQQSLKMEHPDFNPGRIVMTRSGNNGLATFSFKDKVAGIAKPVFYQFSFIEGPDGIFTLTGWCEEGNEVEFLKEYQRFTAGFNPATSL